MNETWKPVQGYEGLYMVSNMGRVAGLKKRRFPAHIMHQELTGNGYLRVGLFKDGKQSKKKVHRIVAEAFIPNPGGKPQVNHINGVRTDNRVCNLEWCTQGENLAHSFRELGRKPSAPWTGRRSPNRALTDEQADAIRKDRRGSRAIAAEYGVSEKTVQNIKTGKTYRKDNL